MIDIRVEDAYLTHDTDLLSRMDPYVVIHYGGERRQTSVRNNGGQNPRWGEGFQFMRTGDTMIRLEVWDKDTFTQDDLVGQGQVNLGGILNNPMMGATSQAVDLYYQGRSAGRVNLSIRPQGMGMGMGGMGMGMPMGGMGMPMGGMGMGGGMYQGGFQPGYQGGFQPGFQGGFNQGGYGQPPYGGGFNNGW